jgi:NAD(P)-dependent dehydrogenase (short-subunit alcohol dehydrogenase family)
VNLQDKVAVVTGASGGIGSATARRLTAAGCKVVV